jgi:predicted nucleic acid-binding protein
MADRVLVDTSAWIDFFRKKDPALHHLVATLLREARALGTGVVALELLRGAKTAKELIYVSELFETIEIVDQLPSTYRDAGKMGYKLAREGHTLSVVDLLIAQLAIENELQLLSLDKHFPIIAETFPLKLLFLDE